MAKTTIKSIQSVNVQGAGWWYSIGGIFNERVIAKIVDKSNVYPDYVYARYDIEDADGNLIARLENTPVEITYDIAQ